MKIDDCPVCGGTGIDPKRSMALLKQQRLALGIRLREIATELKEPCNTLSMWELGRNRATPALIHRYQIALAVLKERWNLS